jgi:uncharacterized protein
VARPGGVSYLRIPARDVAQSAEFYRAVFGWRLRGTPQAPSFSDGTGHVIGHWRTDLPAAGQAGILPYIYVTDLDDTLRTAAERGAELITLPYPEGNLKIACRVPKPRHGLWPAVLLMVTQPARTRGSARRGRFFAGSPHRRDR